MPDSPAIRTDVISPLLDPIGNPTQTIKPTWPELEWLRGQLRTLLQENPPLAATVIRHLDELYVFGTLDYSVAGAGKMHGVDSAKSEFLYDLIKDGAPALVESFGSEEAYNRFRAQYATPRGL